MSAASIRCKRVDSSMRADRGSAQAPSVCDALPACLIACLLAVFMSIAPVAEVAYADDAESSASAAASKSSESAAKKDEIDQDNLVDPTQRADNSFIYDTNIETLFEQPSLYDGRTVQIVGEVIGDKIAADDSGRCWITLTTTDEDNKSTISVLISRDQATQVDHYGRYGVTGTILQVRGTYHQACAEHQGPPDIHAIDSKRISRGVEHKDKFSFRAFIPGAIAVCIGFVMMGVYYVARERSR